MIKATKPILFSPSKRVVLLMMLLLGSIQYGKAQFESNFEPTGGFHTTFNKDDFLTGLSLGVFETETKIRLTALFMIRPFENKVLIKQSSNFYIQYRERRFLLGPVADKCFELTEKVGVSLKAGIVYTFADYAGSKATPVKKWTPILGGGLDIKIVEDLKLRFSYQHMPLPHVGNQTIGISLIIFS